jgi:PKD repeat protein
MKRVPAVLFALGLGMFFVFTVTTTQAATPAPIERGTPRLLSANAPRHTQPITPGAPVDIALVLDRSESQSYDFTSLPEPYRSKCNQSNINDNYACLNGGMLWDGTTVIGCNNELVSDPNFPELTRGICQPFRKSKEAAYQLIQQLRPGTDRMALINFAETPTRVLSMTFDFSAAISMVNSMDVYVSPSDASQPNPTGHILCNSATSPADYWKCGSSNIGGALLQARDEFSSARPEAKWSAVLIVDGPANRTSPDTNVAWSDPVYGICPLSERNTPIKCRDGDVNSRHFATPVVDVLYDADDYAREYGDLIGLDPNLYPSLGSAGIEIFAIGFGKSTVCLTGTYTPPSNGQPAACTNSNPVYGDPDAGEQLLRYIADMGDDGNLSTGPCLDTQAPFRDFDTRIDASGRSDDVGLGLHCGNYYFAPDASVLSLITLHIARRIITGSTPIPNFDATSRSGFSPLVVTFTNLSTGDYTSWLWQFGDGAVSADLNPTHTYATPGIFSVTLTLTNSTTSAAYTDHVYVRTRNIPGTPADIVLVIDSSESQSYDFASLPEPYTSKCNQTNINDMYACVNGGMLTDGTPVTGCNNEIVSDPSFPELTRGICRPFRQSREAAYRLIQQLRPAVDRLALINFNESANRLAPMTFDLNGTLAALNNMDVYVARPDNATGHIPCNSSTPVSEVWKCGSSNIGAGIILAHDEFALASPYRPDAQWAAILLADGAANRTLPDLRIPWSDPIYGTCPASEQSTPLKCRDADANSRHFFTDTVDPLYDADDYARDYGDLTGLNPFLYPSIQAKFGLGVQMFTIGLGKQVVCLTGNYTPPVNGQPATCTNPNPLYGDPDAGEQLLRYIADMGDDGILSTGPCLDTQAPFRDFDTRADASGRADDVGLGLNCGNYYFAPDATAITSITLDIARRLLAPSDSTPDFSASPLNGVAPLSVTFDNLSTGSYTSTLWTFGDGGTSTAISPTHLYTAPGAYTVTLTIADITATIGLTRSNYITVYQPVHADFSATPLSGTAPLTVTFTNQSTGDYTDVLWNFGDGITSTLTNPTHTYSYAGGYTVTLQASGLGGTDWITRPNVITVYQAVHADFSATPLSGTAPLTVTFANQATGDYTNLLWNFGDGITSTLGSPTHVYAAGVYTVSLRVSGLGGTDVLTRTNYINASVPQWHIYLPIVQNAP